MVAKIKVAQIFGTQCTRTGLAQLNFCLVTVECIYKIQWFSVHVNYVKQQAALVIRLHCQFSHCGVFIVIGLDLACARSACWRAAANALSRSDCSCSKYLIVGIWSCFDIGSPFVHKVAQCQPIRINVYRKLIHFGIPLCFRGWHCAMRITTRSSADADKTARRLVVLGSKWNNEK